MKRRWGPKLKSGRKFQFELVLGVIALASTIFTIYLFQASANSGDVYNITMHEFKCGMNLNADGTVANQNGTTSQPRCVPYHENSLHNGKYFTDSSNCTKYSAGVCEEWCADFVSWVYKKAGEAFFGGEDEGIHDGWRISHTSNIKAYLQKHGSYQASSPSHPPSKGDIFYTSAHGGHVGIVTGSNSSYVYTVSGNSSNQVAATQYSYSQLDGYGRPSGIDRGFGAVRDSFGKIHVLGLDINFGRVYEKKQTSTGGYSGWSPVSTGASYNRPAIAMNKDGRLEAFVRGTNGVLSHAWQSSPGSSWSSWSKMGGTGRILCSNNVCNPEYHTWTSGPAVERNNQGGLEVFIRGKDNAIWHAWQKCPGCSFTDFSSLGGKATSNPAVARNKDGRLEVFYRGGDNAVWHRWQTCATGCAWSGEGSLGGVTTSSPAAVADYSGSIWIFAAGSNRQLYANRQGCPGCGFIGFNSLGSPNGAVLSDPGAALDSAGGIEVFIAGQDHLPWHRKQPCYGCDWSGWSHF